MWIDFEDVCLGRMAWDLAMIGDAEAVAAHHRPDPEVLARCTELQALQVALAPVVFYDDLGDLGGRDDGIRGMLGTPGGGAG